MANHRVVPRWKPGVSPYAEYLKELKERNDGSYELHIEERRHRKNAKKQFQKLAQHNQVKIMTKMHNALMRSLEIAEQTGDMSTIEKVAKLLDISTPNLEVDVKSDEVVDAIKEFTKKLPD